MVSGVLPKTKLIPVSEITTDDRLQSREAMDNATVQEYAEAYRNGVKLPPLVVFALNRDIGPVKMTLHALADGYHRLAGAKLAGVEKVECEVHNAEFRDAILYAAGANANHGLRRTNADKRRAVEMLLSDEEWAAKSDRWIADQCRVDHKFVGKVRRESRGDIPTCREGRDGKSYQTMDPGEVQLLNEMREVVRQQNEAIDLAQGALDRVYEGELWRESDDSFEAWVRARFDLEGLALGGVDFSRYGIDIGDFDEQIAHLHELCDTAVEVAR